MRRRQVQRNPRTILLAACLALALAAGGVAAFATEPAAEGVPDAPARPADSPADALEQAAEALAEAKARSAAADAAYSRMRARNWPRGAKREMIVLERSQAHRALLEAVKRYEALGGDASEHR